MLENPIQIMQDSSVPSTSGERAVSCQLTDPLHKLLETSFQILYWENLRIACISVWPENEQLIFVIIDSSTNLRNKLLFLCGQLAFAIGYNLLNK